MNVDVREARRDGYYWPEGRAFRMVPRVMRCANEREGIVFHHGADNPFSQPRLVVEQWKGHPLETRLIRWYGLALRQMSARYGKFDVKVHVVPDESIPKEGTNYMLCDPHPARNFAMGWVRCVKGTDHYIYREWPGTKGQSPLTHKGAAGASPREVSWQIPGVGDPGAWTENDPKRQDGRPGPAQRKFNFGLLEYKAEIARLEGWKDWRDAKATGFDWSKCKTVSAWSEWNGADEVIFDRIIDSRAASAPRVENDRPVTLQTQLEDIGLLFSLAKGYDVDAADPQIDTLLSFDREQPVGFLNSPHLFVAESCRNFIYMFENYTGLKETGSTDPDSACKEWADLLRYYLLADPVDVGTRRRRQKAGVYF